MSDEVLRATPSAELTSILELVETSGEIAVIFPSASIGDLEIITGETQRRQLRIAGIPRGGVTILPGIPLFDDDLVNLCVTYSVADEKTKVEMRSDLYMRQYPFFLCGLRYHRPLFHPADYVCRILQFCSFFMQAPEAEVPALHARSPFLHISPIREICAYLRRTARGVATVPDGALTPVPEQLRFHAELDAERLHAERVRELAVAPPGFDGSDGGAPQSEPPLPAIANVAPSDIFNEAAVSEADEDGVESAENLTGEEVVDAVHASEAEYLTLSELDLVTEASTFYDSDGDEKHIAAVYIPRGVSREMCKKAAAALQDAATTQNRRAATNNGLSPNSGIAGYYDYLTNPTPRKCRETAFTRQHAEQFSKSESLLKQLDTLYGQFAPMHHHLQRVAIPSHHQLFGTAFSTVTVNRNFRTAVHTDRGDFRGGLGVLCVIDGNFEGCHLGIKKLKKAFQLKVGDVLLFKTSLEHGNTEVTSDAATWERTSVVCYLRTGLMSSVCEMERRKRLNSLLVRQLSLQAVRQTAININGADASLPPLFVPTLLVRELAPVQLAALGFIVERASKRSGSVVAMTMGLGKTLVALTLCFSHLHLAPQSDVLIVTPKPIISHWASERDKWDAHGLHLPHFVASDGLTQVEFESQLSEYERQLRSTVPKVGHVFILNGEYLTTFLHRFKNFSPTLLIVDEGHRVASKGNKLTESLDRLRCNHRVVLSGTPLQNDANELYRLVGWVNKGASKVLPPRRFQELANEINRFVEGDDRAFYGAVMAQNHIQDWMRGFVFREMGSRLPPLHDYLLICGSSAVQREYEVKLDLTAESITALKATEHRPHHLSTHPACYLAFISSSYQSMVSGWEARKRSASTMSTPRVLENAETALLEQYGDMVATGQLDTFLDLSGKMRVLVEIVRRVAAQNEKVIIFSLYVGSQDFIHRVLLALNVYTYTVRGRDTQARRHDALQRFKDEREIVALVLSTKIAAYGLDLTAANHVVLFDSWWNPQMDAQAIARAYRQNQRKPVTVYRLISTTENRFVLRSQTRKIALFKCLLHECTSRQALPSELDDCAEGELDGERRKLWEELKRKRIQGGAPALLNVYRHQEIVREGV
ncbi:j-binding protein [Novymonas esmeraldas]|uniref:Bifunctional helicase and thymine dioxygenase JBP2 n=1 Tax=Novymonas esmeraldas TaxID=1808958 RepID=A0AAW0ES90_9TRYP